MELPGTALRIDNYLKGDWLSISSALKKEGLEESLDGAKAPFSGATLALDVGRFLLFLFLNVVPVG